MENNKYIVDNIEVFAKIDTENNHQSVLIVLQCNNKFVLARNKKRGGLELPGGHKDNDETIEETAARESLEEVGAIIKNIKIIGYYILPTGHKTIITKAEVNSFIELDGSFETENVELFDDIPQERLSFQCGLYNFIIKNLM